MRAMPDGRVSYRMGSVMGALPERCRSISHLSARVFAGERTFEVEVRRSLASGPHVAFELAFGPGQDLLHGLAVEVADGHLALQAGGVDLLGDLVRRGSGR